MANSSSTSQTTKSKSVQVIANSSSTSQSTSSTSQNTKFKRVHRSLRFRSGRDIMDIAPNNCPNITELLEKDAIQDRSVPALFNQIEGIADIGARVRDCFDILNYQNSIVRIRGARKESNPDDE